MSDRETTDLFLGHPAYAGRENRSRIEGTDRFVVYVVYRDGVRRDLSKYDHLLLALEERDRELEAHKRDGYGKTNCHLAVYDSDDPERGDLDYDHLDSDR